MFVFRSTYLVFALLVLSIGASAAWSQSADDYDTSAMVNNELYQFAEALRLGRGIDENQEVALELHTQLAEAGDARSYERMANILLSRSRLSEAKAALEAGRDAGSDLAELRLAEGHVQNKFGSLSDPELGFTQLQAMARTSEDPDVLFLLARAYEEGSGTPVQTDTARDIYEELAASGHAQSLRRIGNLAVDRSSSETELGTAEETYLAAIENGSDDAWLDLADLYVGQGRYGEAIDAYRSAIANDVDRAEVTFARRHFLREFGSLSDRSFGARWLEDNAENGNIDAAIEALILWERKSRRINTLDLEGVIATLDAEMRAGNQDATIALARAYRVLRWRLVQARTRHAEIVSDFSAQLGQRRMREFFYNTYDRDHHSASREAAYEVIRGLEGEEFRQAARAIRFTERTAFVFMLQKEFGNLGYYNGVANGIFNTGTLRATLEFCELQGISDVCVHGPLNYVASMQIIRGLSEVRGE